jgi:hypothetical protein
MMVVVLALGVCSSATAQISTYADVKAKSGAQLSAADLNQLMPGAKVVSRTQAGSTRIWENKSDGTFVASSDGRGSNARCRQARRGRRRERIRVLEVIAA